MRLAALALACLVVLAGCGAGGDRSAPTATPALVPSADADADRRPLAPGVRSTGVVDPTALVGEHVRLLRNDSFRVESVVTRWGTDADIVRSRTATVGRFDETGDYHVRRVASGSASREGKTRTVEQHVEGDLVLRRTVEDGATTYARGSENAMQGVSRRATLLPDPTTSRTLFLLFQGLNVTVETTRRDGAAVYRLRAVGVRDPAALRTLASGNVSDVAFGARVAASGLVRSYWFAYTAVRGSEEVRTVRQVTFDGVGATRVERPPWYDAALNETAGADGSTA
jgi:hypothetical protein